LRQTAYSGAWYSSAEAPDIDRRQTLGISFGTPSPSCVISANIAHRRFIATRSASLHQRLSLRDSRHRAALAGSRDAGADGLRRRRGKALALTSGQRHTLMAPSASPTLRRLLRAAAHLLTLLVIAAHAITLCHWGESATPANEAFIAAASPLGSPAEHEPIAPENDGPCGSAPDGSVASGCGAQSAETAKTALAAPAVVAMLPAFFGRVAVAPRWVVATQPPAPMPPAVRFALPLLI